MKDSFNISKLRNIALAGILATGVVSPAYLSAYAYADEASAQTESTESGDSSSTSDDVNSILDKLFGTGDDDDEAEAPSKSETVYVFTKADGSAKSTIVTDWLKNADGDSSLKDQSDLTDIENTESDAAFTQDGNAVTWDAQGSDIYYKGNTYAQAPVQMKVTYTLDGEEISPDELAGKSGKVTIRFDYTNNSSETKTVGGKERTIYTPFACVTGLMLDNDSFKNITVENARTANDGDRTIIAGFAFPGLQEDLDLSDDTAIPDHFEITADVTDFKMDATLTLVSAGLLNNIQTDDLDEDAIGDDIEAVEDAMGQLMSGSEELADGLGQLSDGANTLADGAGQLSDGSQTLAAGTQTLADGAGQLSGSTGSLVSGVNQLADASVQVDNGLDQLTNGTSTATGLVDAVDSIGVGSTSTDTLYGGTVALQNGLAQLKGNQTDQTGSLYAAKNGADQITAGAQSLSAGTKALISAIGTSEDTYDLATQTGTVNGALNAAYAALGDTGDVKAALEALQNAQSTLQQCSTDATNAGNALEEISNALSEVDLDTLKNGANAAASSANQAAADIDSITASPTGVEEAKTAIGAIDTSSLSDEEKAAVERQKQEALDALNGVSASVDTASKEKAKADAQAAATAAGQVSTGISEAQESLGPVTKEITTAADSFKTAGTQLDEDAKALSTIDPKKVKDATSFATAQALIQGVQSSLNKAVGTSADTSGTLYAAKNGAEAIAKGSQSISSGMDTAIYAIDNQFNPGLEELKDGLKTLADGGTAPDGRSSAGLSGAVQALGSSNTSGTLLYGTGQMRYGLTTLASQAPLMKEGIDQIDSGAGQVNTGAQTIASNMVTLASGAGTLASGASTAYSGSQTLADGLSQFNEQAVQKIVDAYHDNLEGLSDNLRATVQAGKDYSTFSGKDDSMDGSVKFVYETDSIGVDDDSSSSDDASADGESTDSE